jgi:hypothetical protein
VGTGLQKVTNGKNPDPDQSTCPHSSVVDPDPDPLVRGMDPWCGSGSISKRHGSVDPDPHKNVKDAQYCPIRTLFHFTTKYPCKTTGPVPNT